MHKISVFLVIIILFCACSGRAAVPAEIGVDASKAMHDLPQLPEPAEVTVNIKMLGDNLLHLPVVYSGRAEDGSYNFDHIFENIKPYIAAADIAVINQETPLASEILELSEYPRFNAPHEMAAAIENAGISVVALANNHAADMGTQGLLKTIEVFKRYPSVTVTGAYASAGEREEIPIVRAGGVDFAFLSYTMHLNGLAVDEDKAVVNIWEEELAARDIENAKKSADFIVVLMHWGEEYTNTPTAEQEEIAQFLAENDVDLVLGTHPHVIQPMQWVESSDGRKTLVYYSLGNFVSRQNYPARMIGAMADITVAKKGNDISIKAAEIHPLVTHYIWGKWDKSYTVYMLSDYTEQLAALHGMNKAEKDGDYWIKKDPFTIEWIENYVAQILSF